ncbi:MULTISPECIES: C-GCAxxG-C-C family protein [unclassified Dehalobacter]|uniref:C-GCAxxG-C-C family protein n=1 Tax=unclassified Dehalobacter TaxID=2635733 RepID=UPI00059C18E3|nr:MULTISPECIES: C-GCAxxG-C-C family protein [unclassified Dehalobacter]
MNDTLIQELKQNAEQLYRSGDYLCSEAVFTVVNDYLGRPLPPEAVRITSGFPVGIGHAGCTCGALNGAVVALGLKYGRTGPKQDNQEIISLSKELHDEFKKKFGSTCCRVIIKDFTFGSPEHLEHCINVTGEATKMVLNKL